MFPLIVGVMQLREGISQDQEKTEVLQGQLQDLERNIQTMDAKIQHNEATLKDLRKLEKQKMSKTDVRSTLYKVKEEQHANLAEENEGMLNKHCWCYHICAFHNFII